MTLRVPPLSLLSSRRSWWSSGRADGSLGACRWQGLLISTHTELAAGTVTRLLSQVFSFFSFALSNVIFERAHSSRLTKGRACSAEGHRDTWAEWMTFRVQFSIFHHFLWKALRFTFELRTLVQTHTRAKTRTHLSSHRGDRCRKLSAATEFSCCNTTSYMSTTTHLGF